MRNRKCTKTKRLLSFFLAVLVAVSILPMSWLQASAATEKHPDAVTITVTDGNGKALADAVVNYTIESQTDVENPISGIVMTDEDGCAEVLSGDDYKENDLELTAQVSKEHYESNDTAIVSLPITSADQNFEVSLRCVLIEDVTVTGVTEAYADGKKIPAATVEGIVTDGEHPDKVTYELYTYGKDETTGKDEWVSAGQTSELPQISEVGNYKLAVSVDRGEQYEIYRTEVDSEITLGKITDYTITPLNETYTGAKEGQELPKYDAVTVTGGRKTDNVTYKLGTGEKTETIPQIQYAGTYSVTVRVERENYEPFEQTYTAVLKSKANEYKGTYDGKYHRLIESVEGTDPNNKDIVVEYSVSEKKEESSWSREVPKGVNAGSYPVYIRIDRDNDGKFEETIDAIATIDPVSIELKNISDEIPESVTYEEARNRTYDYSVKAFGVDDQEFDSSVVKITYSIESAEKEDSSEESGDTEGTETGNASTDMKEIATIDEGGQLQVQEAGGGHSIYVVVKVELKDTCSEKNNYIKKTRKTQLDIVQTDGLLKFEENGNIVSSKKYVFGTNNGIISNLKAWKSEKDNGTITYSTTVNGENSENYGISIDKTSGKLSISNYENLAEKLVDNNGALTVKVTAHKTAGTKWVRKGFGLWAKKVLYEKADADYSINIQFEATPENSFSLKSSESADAETITANEAGWFQQAVYVVPAEGYQIASEWKNDATKTLNAMSCVVFNNQGESERIVYLKSTTTGGITAPIKTGIEKIDSVRPDAKDIEITYSASTSPILEMLNKIFHFYDKTGVEVTITAKDATSGIKALNWIYIRADDASDSNLEQTSGTLTDIAEVKTDRDKKVYQATLPLPVGKKDQLNGNLQVQAVDAADLSSDYMTDTDNIVVVDSISPKLDASYSFENATEHYQKVEEDVNEKKVNHHYTSDDVTVTLKVKEANFYADDVTVTIKKTDVSDKTTDYSFKGSKLNWEKITNKNAPEDDDGKDWYQAEYTLSEEGDYVITLQDTDHSGNVEEKVYTSEVITIDKTAPTITFEEDASVTDKTDPKRNQKVTVNIDERNFRAKDISVTGSAKNIKGEDDQKKLDALNEYLQQEDSWKIIDKKHVAELSLDKLENVVGDAIYDLKFEYKDLAKNSLAGEEKEYCTGVVLDREAPTNVKVSYSDNYTTLKKIFDKVAEAVTGKKYFYYNKKVTLTFTAQDEVSGVDHFTWSYAKEANASNVNKDTGDSAYTLQTVDAVQDKEKPEQFSATVVLPRGDADQLDQLRGNFIYAATDKCKKEIKNPIVDNENVIVVDTKVPTMTATYTTPSRKEGNHWYYNKNIDLTFAVTEANFYAEDVKVELSRNAGATYTEITPAWTDESVDLHIGTYTIPALKNHSNDADYKIRVTYEDRSGNVMKEYVSNVMTIDTKAPIISVSYTNKDVKNVLADAEGHNRSYFNATQTATVTINEHNFVGKEVDYTIIAKDVTGKVLNADALCQKSGWTDRGDIHTMTITYPGDANYTFDVAYADLATNQATDYSEDYFTVDKTVPSGLTVTYSPSILDTALNGISYGFYNAKVRVTLTANDDIAGVHDFKYAYTKAAGVSAVNAELINQIIEEAGITYSADGRTATSTFEIPKNALTNDTQFNGTVQFTAKDRSENESGELADTKRLVVDNIAPTANVEYNTPVHQENGISYYDGAVTATVTMNEANFYPEDVVVSVTKDGAAYSVSPSWSDQGTDVHIGTFTLSEDGDYFITMNYRDKSSNQMVEYSSEQLTVDTEITAPVITVNGEEANGRAFKNEVVPAVSFNDINFDSYKITLTRTRYDVKDEDVTEKYIGSAVALDGQGGSGSFDTFEKEAETDGIYTMTVSMTDKAGHSAETTATFTVNRFGSVYVYNDQLIDLIQDGGAYVQPSAIKDDLVITEYNADRLLADSLDVEVLCDGKPMADTDYSVTPEINDQAPIGSSGWYQYQYTIAKENFAKDGVYKIAVASKDATGNSPETTNYEDKEILFHVDGTAPEITSIAGLEDTIINAQSVDATYSVYDTMGLKSIKVLVDGKVVDEITDFSADRNNYEGDFVVNESKDKQKVELVVTDLAGNVTDTDSEEFKEACAYEFNDVVTISTNPMVRAMAWIKDHAKVIAGTVAVVAATVAGIIVLVLVRRRKDSEDDSESGGDNSEEK